MKLDPYPPGNPPAGARVHVRGTQDEVQALVEASLDQKVDIFQVIGGEGAAHLAVDGEGKLVVGSQANPRAVVLHDAQSGKPYALSVSNGQLALTPI